MVAKAAGLPPLRLRLRLYPGHAVEQGLARLAHHHCHQRRAVALVEDPDVESAPRTLVLVGEAVDGEEQRSDPAEQPAQQPELLELGLGERMRRIREDRGLAISQLAERSGVAEQQLQAIALRCWTELQEQLAAARQEAEEARRAAEAAARKLQEQQQAAEATSARSASDGQRETELAKEVQRVRDERDALQEELQRAAEEAEQTDQQRRNQTEVQPAHDEEVRGAAGAQQHVPPV